jgi:class 3 adenylate cyclase/tetratricopeptide (TPR) repeat protein
VDVGGWLRGLGLGQYEEKFRDNKVDAAVLPQLTADDLKDIGVAAVGDRRKLLAAIAALAGAMPPASSTASAPKPSTPKSAQVSAERRPITVMFCDLLGSTGLSAKLDPEDWRNLVNAYLDEASAAVAGLGGHVLKKLGDGLMALFGYPTAQENDAERAVRAALAIQRALAEINAKNRGKGAPELLARIGVESGPVVVEATGEVFGDAPNIAARVQATAEPGSVLITVNVQRQVAGLFVAEERGPQELKGVSEPVQLFRIVRASGAGRRGGARALTPFVGREEELGMLARRWERAKGGEGQLVLIVGEPGLGKSRLIDEFHARLAETPHTWTEWSASQLLQNTPLHPITEWGRLRFGADAPADQRLADLENTLRAIGLDPGKHAPLLAPLVDIPLPPERAASFPPEELRRRQLAAMTALFLAGARSQPVVLAFEDLHWADPTSLDLLRALAERGAQAPLLLLATTRPEFRPPWSLRSHHSLISLSPLDHAGVARMVNEISARHALSKEVIEGVSERTGGVPLFVEEVTRLLLERGEQGGVQAIPPTLQQSLAARLDRLGSAREIAQIGAVLGREFGYSLLRDVAETDEPGLQTSLDRLAEADLLFVADAPPQANYRFKHALIQDAAYESLLKSRRQTLHRRAAEILRDQPEHAAAEPEVIAHHFTQAGLDDPAIEWWGKAGDQALRRSAFQEAIAHLGKAIAMADKAVGAESDMGSTGVATPSGRLKLQTDYGQAVMWSKGFAAEETKAAFARASDLAANTNNFAARFATAHSQWASAIVRGEQRRVRELASSFLQEAEDAGWLVEVGVAHRGLAQACYLSGEFLEARTHCERALDACDPEREKETRERFTDDTGPIAISLLAMTMWQLGEVGRARELIEQSIRRGSELGHAPSMAHPLNWKCHLEILRGDAAAALSAAEILEGLCQEHGMPFWRVKAELDAEWARGRLHDATAGADGLRRALAAAGDQGMMGDAWFYTVLLAELEARTLGADSALKRIDEALVLARKVEDRCDLAFLYLLRGDLLLKCDPSNPAAVEEAFQTALSIAKVQGARSWGLRAALSLAKLYQSTNRPVEAHAVLAPPLEGFSPTPEMPEIAEAQAMLAALAEAEEVVAAEAQGQRRLHLQTAYSQAMMWSKGYSAGETKAAFARATELAGRTGDFSERFFALQGQWGAAVAGGELRFARELAFTLLREADDAGRAVEAGWANAGLGLIAYWRGDFVEARSRLERAIDVRDTNADPKVLERLGDVSTYASSWLALPTWAMGEVDRARELINWATQRASEIGHIGAIADALMYKSYLEVRRDDPLATLSASEALEPYAREHGMKQYVGHAELHASWARGRLHDPAGGAAELRQALAALTDCGQRISVPIFYGLLAELEAETLGADSAILRIDDALTLAHEIEHRCDLALIHRFRGDILLKRNPADQIPAEDAYQTAIAIAKEQGARSYHFLAALALAKLYQSTARALDAHAVLAPALEGFSPTSEMPEIAEAQALLVALTETEEVKAAEAQRQRRVHLQTAYGQAMMWAKGFSAEETRAAFLRATELTAKTDSFADRFAAGRFHWNLALTRGELRSARELELSFLKEAEDAGRMVETGVVRRGLALACYQAADFLEARTHCERALEACDPESERETQERFHDATGPIVLAILAVTMWQLGEADRARELIEQSIRRGSELGHGLSMAHPLWWKSRLEILRADAAAALSAAKALEDLSREHGMPFWRTVAELSEGWARGRLHDAATGAEDLRRAQADRVDQDLRFEAWFHTGLLAELEAETLGAELALTRIDEAIALARG